MAGLTVLLGLAVVVSAGTGYIRVPPLAVLDILAARLTGLTDFTAGMDPLWPVVVMDVRLPRLLTAAVVGGGLSLSGAVFQGLLRNPLADPYTLGVSAGAAFGAALALVIRLRTGGVVPMVSVPAFAFLGALISLAVVIHLAGAVPGGQGRAGLSSASLVLAGIIVTAILSAAVSFLKYLADEQVGVIIFWLMGGFASRGWADAGITLAVTAVGFAVSLWYARDLNLMTLGDRAAASLGVHPTRLLVVMLTTASLVTAVCVAASGIIGFVGLVVPHMVRAASGPDHRRLLPAALLAGAVLLLLADTLVRAVLPSLFHMPELPIGVLTALVGGPFFCVILRRRGIRA